MVTHLLHIDWDRGFLQGSVANRNLGAGVVLVGLSVSVLCGLQTEDFDESTAPARTRRPSATTAPALSEACASLRKPGWSDKLRRRTGTLAWHSPAASPPDALARGCCSDTSPTYGRNAALTLLPDQLAHHWGETGGTLASME